MERGRCARIDGKRFGVSAVCNIYRHRNELKKISPAVEAMSFQNIDRFNAVPLHAGAAHFKNNRTDECDLFDMSDRSRSNGLTARVIAVVCGLALSFPSMAAMAGFMPPGTIPFEDLFGMQPAVYFRPAHLLFILVLGLLLYPVKKRGGFVFKLFDFTLIGAAIWATYRILKFDYQGVDHLLYGLYFWDLLAGLILIRGDTRGRKTIGRAYNGNYRSRFYFVRIIRLSPARCYRVSGIVLERILRFQIFTNAGMFGVPLE